VEEAVVIFGIIAIIYTVLGGISAVIWTDVIQFTIMSLGMVASMAVVVLATPGGWDVAFAEAGGLGKLDILHAGGALGGQGLLTAIFGYGLLALSLFGTNQQPVQRYMTVKHPREAQGALLLGVAPAPSASRCPCCWASSSSSSTSTSRPCCRPTSPPTRSCPTS
jgi:solute:Na+ symporter, SSS family